MAFIFYDTETTGTVTAFDQILQFAAIKTDAELNEVDRFEIRCRLLPYVVPAPGAMRVTGIKASQLSDPAFCSHYDMVRHIRTKFLEWSPAVVIGYNSLDYDEHILRQAFYKTLHPPYLTNTNGNCRADALRMVRAASVLAKGEIVIPHDDAGKPVFKLDKVAPANGFNHAAAHEAMADVEATIHICRLMMTKAPAVWSTAMRFSQKAAVANFVGEESIFCILEFFFGAPYAYIVTPIGENPEIKSEFFIYDLQVNPEGLVGLDDEKLAARLSRSPKPVRRLKSNASPMLMASEGAPSIAAASSLSAEELQRRVEFLKSNESLRTQLAFVFQGLREPKEVSPFVELQIYDGFWSKADELLMESFHSLPWESRLNIIENFQDPRLKTIATLLVHVERPDLLEEAIRGQHDAACVDRLLGSDGEVPWLTLPMAIAEIEGLITASEAEDLAHLQEHHHHLKAWLTRIQAAVNPASGARSARRKTQRRN